MVQGMSRDAWDEFSKTILVRYVLSYLSGTLYLDPSTSLKRIFAFSTGVFLAFQPMPQLALIFLPSDSQMIARERRLELLDWMSIKK